MLAARFARARRRYLYAPPSKEDVEVTTPHFGEKPTLCGPRDAPRSIVKITPPESYGEHTSRYPNDAHNSYFYATPPIRVTNQMTGTPSPRQAQYLLTRRAEPGLPLLELPAYCLARP